MSLGDGVIVAVSRRRGNRPTILKVRSIALRRRSNGCVDAVVDALEQLEIFRVQVNALVFRRI